MKVNDGNGSSDHEDIGGERRKSTDHETDLKDDVEVQPQKGCKRRHVWKAIANKAIDANATIAFMSLVVAYVLYSDDCRILLALDPSADRGFLVLSSIAFALFLTEMLLLCWCRDNYLKTPNFASMKESFTLDCWRCRTSNLSWLGEVREAAHIGSFYFWLDLIATLSMLIEMPWFPQGHVDPTVGKISTTEAFIKVKRMVRLTRLAKLHFYFAQRQTPDVHPDARRRLGVPEETSHVGAEMSDRTTKRVIVGILIMLVGIPIFLVDKAHYLNEYTMKVTFNNRVSLSKDGINASATNQWATKLWEDSESLLIARTNCIDITYRGFNDGLSNDVIMPRNKTKMHDLSVDEIDAYTIVDADFARSMTAIFDASRRKEDVARLGVLLTSFVIVLLGLGMVTFTRDVHDLVIVPIEQMMQLVKEISENPLGKAVSLSVFDEKHNDDVMETTLLIRTISKIAGLMRVGFGEAGADIIGKSLNFTDDNDTMHILGNGRKIQSIFGFCDVRQFTDTTECLQEEVMLFVNRIAHILHSIVVQCDGAANKNIGDAFLLTWKVNTNAKDQDYIGDKALYSFVKTMIEMTKHDDFVCKFSSRATSELYERIPGYKCRIGCGIHFGWAIEGAMGSLKKIDASYISPHVNFVEALESLTKEYGTSILMSEPFYNLLSPEAVAGCRKVDVIKRRQSDPVTCLYTYDIDLGADFGISKRAEMLKNLGRSTRQLSTSTAHSGPNNREGESAGRKARMRPTESMNSSARGEQYDGKPNIMISNDFPNVWRNDVDLVCARSHFSDKQRQVWSLGMTSFEKGEWGIARDHFNIVLELSGGKDGPSQYLLRQMKELNYCAPDNWQGYRQINTGH